ncbi:MAG: DUF4276 family protein [Desulfomonile sp.]
MKVALIVDGKTEIAFLPFLRRFLQSRLPDAMPKIDPLPYDGRIPTGDKLRRVVSGLLSGSRAADHVTALTDVYTGTQPPEFRDAADAKAKMRQWVGVEPRFHPHAAQYDFEAWLLSYWPSIQKLAGHNRACPAGAPCASNSSIACRNSVFFPTCRAPLKSKARPPGGLSIQIAISRNAARRHIVEDQGNAHPPRVVLAEDCEQFRS